MRRFKSLSRLRVDVLTTRVIKNHYPGIPYPMIGRRILLRSLPAIKNRCSIKKAIAPDADRLINLQSRLHHFIINDLYGRALIASYSDYMRFSRAASERRQFFGTIAALSTILPAHLIIYDCTPYLLTGIAASRFCFYNDSTLGSFTKLRVDSSYSSKMLSWLAKSNVLKRIADSSEQLSPRY